jgi:hypothetical protein
MKRKIKLLSILMIMCLFLTGCKAKYEYEITIQEDKNVQIDFLHGLQLIKAMNPTTDNPTEENPVTLMLKKNNFDVTPTYDAENKYEEVTAHLEKPIEELITTTNKPIMLQIDDSEENEYETIGSNNSLELFQKNREYDRTVYSANWLWRYGLYYSESHSEAIGDNEKRDKNFFYSETGADDPDMGFIYPSLGNAFKVNLPSPPIENNATRVSENGKTLEWDLNDVGLNSIQFSFSYPSTKAVEYNEKDVELNTTNFNEGDIVHFKLKNPDNIEKFTLVDIDGNEIEITEDNGEYTFIMPEKEVQIKIDYKKTINPNTGRNYLIPCFIILLITTIPLVLKKKRENN